MKDMVDSLWAATDATSQVPLEPLGTNVEDEKVLDSPSVVPPSQEKSVHQVNEASNVLPPGLAKIPTVTDGPKSGGSVDDQLEALIDG